MPNSKTTPPPTPAESAPEAEGTPEAVRLLGDGAEVIIRAPMQAVWDYAGDSQKARAWSVYFHHITPQTADGKGRPHPPDGRLGSVRICYRRADEAGVRWSERVTALEPEGPVRIRRIRTYDLRGLGGPLRGAVRYTAYRVEQRYRRVGLHRTALAFRTRLARPSGKAARFLFNRLFRPEVKRLFALNLENIKAAIEAAQAGRPYTRLHPYETSHPWE